MANTVRLYTDLFKIYILMHIYKDLYKSVYLVTFRHSAILKYRTSPQL